MPDVDRGDPRAGPSGYLWITVPVALTLVAIAEVGRTLWRASRPPADAQVLLALEGAATGLLAVPLAVDSLHSPLAAVGGAAIGIALGLWGLATRVRRRLRIGLVTTAAFLAALVLVPLAGWLPALNAGAVWVTIAVVGLAVVGVAAAAERRREHGNGLLRGLWQGGDDWE